MTKSRRLPLLVAALVATLALGACGGDDDDDAADTPTDTPADTPTDEAADEAAPAEADITIQTFQFKPSPAEAAAGTITVTNLDNTTHTFTSGTPDAPDGHVLADTRRAGRDRHGRLGTGHLRLLLPDPHQHDRIDHRHVT